MTDKIMCQYNSETKQIEVILTPAQAESLANELREYLEWFQAVAIPLYNKVFGA